VHLFRPLLKKNGFTTIEIIGRGLYLFTKAENEVKLPSKIQVHKIDTSTVPQPVMKCAGSDEQCMMSLVNHLDLISTFVGFPCHHLQGHLRTTGSLGQQVEADDIFIGVNSKSKTVIVPVEAKGTREKVGYSQMKSTINAVTSRFSADAYLPLSVKMEADCALTFCSYKFKQTKTDKIDEIGILKVCRFMLQPLPKLWCKTMASEA